MLSNEQLAFALSKLYPDLIRWKDYWVAHPVKTCSDKQIGEAEIIEWPKGLEQPDRKTVLKTLKAHADEFNARMARLERDVRLKASDWTQMPDVPEAKRQAWAQYRQLLRDLPQQKDFPIRIVWPQPPAS